MALRAQQDKDVAERTRYTLTPGSNETAQKIANARGTVIETVNKESGELIGSRVVPFTPTLPQRFIRPAPLTLNEVREQLLVAGNTIDAAKEQYKSDTASLDVFYAERNAVKLEIAELQAKLRERQARLTEIESAGTPKDRFLSAIVKSEVDVVSAASSLFTTLCEQAAKTIFGVSFDELSNDGKRDASARFKKVFQRFTSGFYQRLGRTAKTATVEQIDKRSDELLSDVSELIDSEFLK